MVKLPGVEMSTGPLGLGSSAGLGMALAAKLTGKSFRTYVLCGDGELDEGQNWEAFMSIHKWNPKNLTIIIDRNHVQLDGTEEEIMPLGNVKEKLEAFGFKSICCDGHDTAALMDAFAQAEAHDGTAAIIAETVKGKGVSFMEGQSAWHGKPVNKEDFDNALIELEGALK
jgi:transketolase